MFTIFTKLHRMFEFLQQQQQQFHLHGVAASSSIGLTIPEGVCSYVLLMVGGGTA
jgi:hypothetical protein